MAEVVTRGRARAPPGRFRDDEQEGDDDEHIDYGEAEPILSSNSKTGFFGVSYRQTHTTTTPFQARVRHRERMLSLGSFATAEQAARVAAGCVHFLRGKPEPPEPPEAPEATTTTTTLVKSKTKTQTGYFGVSLCPSQGKKSGGLARYQAKACGTYLGKFVTPEAAANAIATRFPELVLAQQEEAKEPPPPPPPPEPPMGPRERGRPWSAAEDEKLHTVVQGLRADGLVVLSGRKAWRRVAQGMGIDDPQGRGARRCYRRWFAIDPENQDVALASRARDARRKAKPKPPITNDVDDAATDATDDDLLVDPDLFFAFEDVEEPPPPPPPPPKPAMTCRVVDACRLNACREDVGLATTFTFGLTNLGRHSFTFSPPPPPPAPTLKRLLDFDGAITAYAQIVKKKRSSK